MDVPSLIREVCERKGSCEILDLGSGVPESVGCHGGGSYGSFTHTAAARQAGLQVSLTAVDLIWPPMSRFLRGESPHSPDYDFPGLAAALKGQGVQCVGEDYNVFIRNAAERALLSAAECSPRPAGMQPLLVNKWDIILTKETALSFASTETATDLRVLINPDGYILLYHSHASDDESMKSLSLVSKIRFAERWCIYYACFRAIVSVDWRYVVLQATKHEDCVIETVVRQ